jgi:Uma2 family endonuclease
VGDKFSFYREVASIQEVLFVDSERRRIETARRTAEGWMLSGPVESGTVALLSVGVDLDLAALYEGFGS